MIFITLFSSFQSQQPWGPNMPPSGVGQSSPLRPPLGPHVQYRPDGKPRPPMPGAGPGVKVGSFHQVMVYQPPVLFCFSS